MPVTPASFTTTSIDAVIVKETAEAAKWKLKRDDTDAAIAKLKAEDTSSYSAKGLEFYKSAIDNLTNDRNMYDIIYQARTAAAAAWTETKTALLALQAAGSQGVQGP